MNFKWNCCPMRARLNTQLGIDLNVKLDWITIMAFNLIWTQNVSGLVYPCRKSQCFALWLTLWHAKQACHETSEEINFIVKERHNFPREAVLFIHWLLCLLKANRLPRYRTIYIQLLSSAKLRHLSLFSFWQVFILIQWWFKHGIHPLNYWAHYGQNSYYYMFAFASGCNTQISKQFNDFQRVYFLSGSSISLPIMLLLITSNHWIIHCFIALREDQWAGERSRAQVL